MMSVLVLFVLFMASKLFVCVKFNLVLELVIIRVLLSLYLDTLELDGLQLCVVFKHLSESKFGIIGPPLIRILLEF